jgi:hypothetical protein
MVMWTEKLLQYLVGPVVVGVVVVLAQYIIQPKIQKASTAESELWRAKRDVYMKVITVLDRRFDSMNYKGAAPVTEGPVPSEINEIFRELLIMCDNDEIPARFTKFMNVAVEGYCSPANRGEFINMLRLDLGKRSFSITPGEIPYFRLYPKQ